jgi:regulator of protease activity HflC (stomatin/prohibitin superfamily)
VDRQRRLSRRCPGARGHSSLRQVRRTTGPGYNWHLPWPIERSIIVNVSQVYSITEDASMLTADTNLVEVHSAVQYTQPDPLKFLCSSARRRGNA